MQFIWRAPTVERAVPGRPGAWAIEVTRPLDGVLEGLTAHVRLTMHDGRLLIADDIRLHPERPMPVTVATVRKLRALRLGDFLGAAEKRLEELGELFEDAPGVAPVVDWLNALRAEVDRRPGRHGRSELAYARMARRRVEAETAAPGAAIAYMVKTWPDDFVSESAAHAKVNRLIHRYGMLERDEGGTWKLTAKAAALLEGKA